MGDPGHPAPLLWHPHPELELYQTDFPNRLLDVKATSVSCPCVAAAFLHPPWLVGAGAGNVARRCHLCRSSRGHLRFTLDPLLPGSLQALFAAIGALLAGLLCLCLAPLTLVWPAAVLAGLGIGFL